jgi:hypothetical protein
MLSKLADAFSSRSSQAVDTRPDGPGRRGGSVAASRPYMATGGMGYRREGMTGLMGIRGGHPDGTYRQPELVPGAYARKNLIDQKTQVPFDYLPGLATQQDLEFGLAATNPGGRPPRAFPVRASQAFGPQLSMDQQIAMIAERRARGLDGRLPKHALVRDVSSDFNKPTDGRPSPYDSKQMQNAVERIWTQQSQLDPRVAESAGQTIDSVSQLVRTMQEQTPNKAFATRAGTAQFYSEHAYGSGGPRVRLNQFTRR